MCWICNVYLNQSMDQKGSTLGLYLVFHFQSSFYVKLLVSWSRELIEKPTTPPPPSPPILWNKTVHCRVHNSSPLVSILKWMNPGNNILYYNFKIQFNTRWFKYDRDYLCVNKSQFVPVIFEPPCIFLLYILGPQSGIYPLGFPSRSR
jgi:hypothetical protein